MNDYEIYLFDWDGTLTNTMQVWMDVLTDQTKRRGLDLTVQQIHELTGNWNVISKYGMDEAEIEQFGIDAHKASDKLLVKAPLFVGAKEVLQALKANGKKLGVVTSCHSDAVQAALPIHGLESMFDVIICGNDSYPHFKPDPKPVQMALEFLKYVDQPAIMWGDADRDLIAAERAGIKSALFYPAHHAEYMPLADTIKNAKPMFTINSWGEALNKLQ